MNKYLQNNRKSNYDKFPVVQVPGEEHSCVTGWENVTAAFSVTATTTAHLGCGMLSRGI